VSVGVWGAQAKSVASSRIEDDLLLEARRLAHRSTRWNLQIDAAEGRNPAAD
jgi:hypothetical protein